MDKTRQKQAMEAMLFVWGEPLSITDMAQALNLKTKEALELMRELQEDWHQHPHGFNIAEVNGSFYFQTQKELYELVSRLIAHQKPKSLTNSALETLSIIAYKQPITRVEIEAIRGVKSSSPIDSLVDRNLICEVGRLDRIGKPILYGTTDRFLEQFHLVTLEDLPSLDTMIQAHEGEEKLDATE